MSFQHPYTRPKKKNTDLPAYFLAVFNASFHCGGVFKVCMAVCGLLVDSFDYSTLNDKKKLKLKSLKQEKHELESIRIKFFPAFKKVNGYNDVDRIPFMQRLR